MLNSDKLHVVINKADLLDGGKYKNNEEIEVQISENKTIRGCLVSLNETE